MRLRAILRSSGSSTLYSMNYVVVIYNVIGQLESLGFWRMYCTIVFAGPFFC